MNILGYADKFGVNNNEFVEFKISCTNIKKYKGTSKAFFKNKIIKISLIDGLIFILTSSTIPRIKKGMQMNKYS